MRRDEALAIIAAHEQELRQHYVRTLSIFGSTARDEARPDSDVDVLVEFDRPVGLFTFIGLKLFLEEILGSPVDLATPDALHHRLRERILSEAIRAA
ncbi:MAG TPA: nucleotidyltransferase family protein [Planctomycetota bacterium]|nr:nucleotidyltransferase family protein [Planctomycetota bacterium]